MFRGRGRGRGRGGFRGGANRLRGLFADGIWQCDCNPRLPAEHFKVKKEGKNQGRWFYTCQKSETERCGFFLWDDDAHLREQGAVLQNTRTEPRLTAGVLDGRHDAAREVPITARTKVSPPPPFSLQSSASSASVRNRASSDAEFDNDDKDWPLNASEMQSIESEAIARMPNRRLEEPKTPAKRNFTTMNEAGLMTPQTNSRMRSGYLTADGEASKRRATDSNFLDLVSPASTPTLMRFRDATRTSSDDPLFVDIQLALSENGISLASEALEAVQKICSQQTMRMRGIDKGREISRLALKAKDAKVAELQMRINTLEAELETERAIIKHLRSEGEYDEG